MQKMIKDIENGMFIMLGKGDNKRRMVHVGNAVGAALIVVGNKAADGKVYIVTDGENYALKEIYHAISKALGKKPLPFYIPMPVAKPLAFFGDLAGRPLSINSEVLVKLCGTLTFSSRRIRDELGFIPEHNLHNTIVETIKAYRAGRCEVQ